LYKHEDTTGIIYHINSCQSEKSFIDTKLYVTGE